MTGAGWGKSGLGEVGYVVPTGLAASVDLGAGISVAAVGLVLDGAALFSVSTPPRGKVVSSVTSAIGVAAVVVALDASCGPTSIGVAAVAIDVSFDPDGALLASLTQ